MSQRLGRRRKAKLIKDLEAKYSQYVSVKIQDERERNYRQMLDFKHVERSKTAAIESQNKHLLKSICDKAALNIKPNTIYLCSVCSDKIKVEEIPLDKFYGPSSVSNDKHKDAQRRRNLEVSEAAERMAHGSLFVLGEETKEITSAFERVKGEDE